MGEEVIYLPPLVTWGVRGQEGAQFSVFLGPGLRPCPCHPPAMAVHCQLISPHHPGLSDKELGSLLPDLNLTCQSPKGV